MGTYVNMEINDGQWVQVHEPTGHRIPLDLPYVNDGMVPDVEIQTTFDMREYLDTSSPGVIPVSHPQPLYQVLGEDVQILRL